MDPETGLRLARTHSESPLRGGRGTKRSVVPGKGRAVAAEGGGDTVNWPQERQTLAELTVELLASVQNRRRGWCVPRLGAGRHVEEVAGHRRGGN